MSENTTNTRYSSLITRVINDFDNIYSSLIQKGVSINPGAEDDRVLSVSDKISTDEYHNYISNQLFRIGDLTLAQVKTDKIADKSGTPQQLKGKAAAAYDATDKKHTITLSIPENGYYTTTSTLTATLTTSTLTVSGNDLPTGFATIATENGSELYVLEVTDEKLLSKVSIAKGEVSIVNEKITETGMTYESVIDATIEDAVKRGVTYAEAKPTDGSYYEISLTNNVSRTGTVEATGDHNVVSGYVTEDDVASTFKISQEYDDFIIENRDIEKKIWIKQGSVSIPDTALSGLETSISEESKNYIDAAGTGNGPVISLSVIDKNSTDGKINLAASVTEGYFKPAEGSDGQIELGDITLNGAEIKIKEGSVSDVTINNTLAQNPDAVTFSVKTDDKNIIGTESNGYKVVRKASATKSIEASEGYIQDESLARTVSVTAEDEFYVKKGKLVVAPEVIFDSDDKITGDKEILTSSSANAYTVTLSASASRDENNTTKLKGLDLTAGFITADEIEASTTFAKATKSIHIPKGLVAPVNSFSVTFTNNDVNGEGSGLGDSTITSETDLSDIFLTSDATLKNKNIDYFTITTTASTALRTAGYIRGAAGDGDIEASDVQVRYLPKADIKVYENDDGQLAINVERGGYLPSGLLSDIDKTDTAISPAEVDLALKLPTTETGLTATEFASLFSLSESSAKYHINASKAASSKSGYISATTGTVNGDIYVTKGSVTAATSITNAFVQDSKGVVKNNTSGKYEIKVSGEVTTEVTTVAGLIANNNSVKLVNTNGVEQPAGATAVENTIETTVSLNTANIIKSDATNSLVVNYELTSDNGKVEFVGADKGGYAITPSIADDSVIKVTAEAGKSGYVSNADSFDIALTEVSNANTQKFYIKKADITATPENDGLKVELADTQPNSNALSIKTEELSSATSAASYKITVSGDVNVKATVPVGYNETSTAQTETVTGLTKTATINRGTVGASVTGTLAIESVTDEERSVAASFMAANESTSVEHITIVTNSSAVTNSINVSESGYVKTVDEHHTASKNITEGRVRIKTVDTTATNSKISLDKTDSEKPVYSIIVGQTSEVLSSENTVVEVPQTKDAYSRYETKVSLTAHAMGSSVIEQFNALESRLNGNITAL